MDAAHALGIMHDLAAIPLRERIGYLIGIAVMIGAAVGAIRRWMQRNPTIRGDALTGTAQVLSMKRAGWLDNDHRPYLRLKLGVQVPGQEPYEVTVQRSVDSVYLSRVQPGATLPVQVDPVNPQIVRLIFDQSIA